MHRWSVWGTRAVLAIAVAAPAHAGGIDAGQARQVVEAGTAEARRLGAPGGVIAVVDDGGHLVRLERIGDTFPAAATVAWGKARTAATFRRATKAFEDAVRGGRVSMVALPEMTPLQGGVPILVEGRVVGAVGVSGAASADQDTQIAEAASVALGAPSAGLTRFDAARVSAAFAAGSPLIETSAYKVHASRRTEAGRSEVHEFDTDIFYVLEGSARFVTGGTLVGGETVAPGEIRGSGIAGGEAHILAPGEVYVVPAGTPHWFESVSQAPVLYYVVKVTEAR